MDVHENGLIGVGKVVLLDNRHLREIVVILGKNVVDHGVVGSGGEHELQESWTHVG